MKAISFDAPLQISLIDKDLPDSPGSHQAKVRVHRVGICGTDMSCYQGRFPFFSFPRTPGHELGVEVLECGSDVANVKVGDRCSVEPYLNNPTSFASRKGRPNCCDDLQVIGVHTDGGMCEEINLPAHKLHVSASLNFEQLALVEPLAIGLHAVNRAQPKPDENVVIVGAGPIGLATLEFVQIRGARPIVVDLNASRLKFCRDKLGVADTIQVQSDESGIEAVEEFTKGNLAEVVFDATGNNASMSRSLEFVAFTGRLVFVGITSEQVSFPHQLMHRREMTLLASRNAVPQEFREIIRLIEDGTVDTDPWITHYTKMEKLSEDFPAFIDPNHGVLKAMIKIADDTG